MSENRLDMTVSYGLESNNKPVLLTEGITDKIILEEAWRKLKGSKEIPFYIQDCFDATFLANLLRRKDSGIYTYNERFFIALFDFDKSGYDNWNSFQAKSIEDDPKKCLTKNLINDRNNNIFVILLPVPENNKIREQVIENGNKTYGNASVLTIEHLFYDNSQLQNFFKEEKGPGGSAIIKFSGDKTKFSEKIKSLNSEDFKNFGPIFKKIEELLSIPTTNIK